VRPGNEMTFRRVIVVVLALWFVVGLVAVALHQSGGSTPPERGQGTEVPRPR
jgi:hypothetical protein